MHKLVEFYFQILFFEECKVTVASPLNIFNPLLKLFPMLSYDCVRVFRENYNIGNS